MFSSFFRWLLIQSLLLGKHIIVLVGIILSRRDLQRAEVSKTWQRDYSTMRLQLECTLTQYDLVKDRFQQLRKERRELLLLMEQNLQQLKESAQVTNRQLNSVDWMTIEASHVRDKVYRMRGEPETWIGMRLRNGRTLGKRNQDSRPRLSVWYVCYWSWLRVHWWTRQVDILNMCHGNLWIWSD